MSRIEVRGVIVPSMFDISLYQEYIEKGIITPESKFRADVAAASGDEALEIYINSPGGSVFAGNEMINTIRDWVQETGQALNITVGAMAASMGSAMMLAAPSAVKVHKNAKIMFHGAWGGVVGGSQAMKDESELLEKINADIKAALLTKTTLSPEVIDEWFSEGREGWLTAEEALEVGLVSEIIDLEADLPEASKTMANAMQERGMQIAALALEPKSEEEIETPAPEEEAPEETPEEEPEESTDGDPEADKGAEDADGPDGSQDTGEPVVDGPADETVNSDVVALSEELEKQTSLARDWQAKHDKLQEDMKAKEEAHAVALEELEKKVEDAEEASAAMSSRVKKLSLQAAAPAEKDSESVSSWPAAVKACNGDLEQAKKLYPDAHKEYFDRTQNVRKP